MKKIKIIFVIPSLRGGGAERIVINIINALNKELFECVLVTLSSQGEYLNLIPSNIKYISLNKERAKEAIIKLRRVIKKEDPNIIFSSIIQANIVVYISSLFLKGIRIITRVSNFYSKIVDKESYINSFLFKKSLKKSDNVVAVSEEMKKDLEINISELKNKIIRIYNPIDIKNISELSIEKIKKDFLIKKPILVSCGRITEQKGYKFLIESILIVKKEFNNVILYILGQGKLEGELKKIIKDLDLEENIKLLGFQENPYKYFKNADLFVLSSLWEGLPGVLIEALASGTLVVSTDCPSGPSEIIKGEYGKLVKIADSEDLAKGIIYMLNKTNRKELIKEGQKRAEDFDSKKIIKEYEKLFLGK